MTQDSFPKYFSKPPQKSRDRELLGELMTQELMFKNFFSFHPFLVAGLEWWCIPDCLYLSPLLRRQLHAAMPFLARRQRRLTTEVKAASDI